MVTRKIDVIKMVTGGNDGRDWYFIGTFVLLDVMIYQPAAQVSTSIVGSVYRLFFNDLAFLVPFVLVFGRGLFVSFYYNVDFTGYQFYQFTTKLFIYVFL